MRPFVAAIILAVLAITVTFALVPNPSQQQDRLIDGYVIRSEAHALGKFKDSGYNSLSNLAVGRYPSVLPAIKALPPMVASNSSSLQKRACNCPAGYGCCPDNKCCPGDQLCSTAGCCDREYLYTCGGKYCCPYSNCSLSGHCGCESQNQQRCGDNCCFFGCTADGQQCACPKTYPTSCEDGKTCCPPNAVCAGNGKCSPIGSNTTSTSTSIATAAPQPSSGLSESGSAGGNPNAGGAAVVPAGANSLQYTSVMMAALLAIAAILAAGC
ncbi:hypothetical protein BGZ54_010056 [Gamsiella multidivaricata]|nr:hypothetical protein BGZ54_010056 [Gamsiella multidivaricata]